MRYLRVCAAVVAVLITGGLASAQSTNEALAVEAAWAAARRAGTSIKMTSKDFFNVTPTADVRGFGDLNERPLPDYHERDCTGRLYGVAMVVVCTQRNSPTSAETRFLKVFVKEAGQWMAVLSHGVRIAPSPEPPSPVTERPPDVRAYSPANAAEREVLDVQTALTEAFASADAASYGRHTAPEFVRITSAGDVRARDAFLKTVAAVQNRRPALQDEVRARIYGGLATVSWKDIPVDAAGMAGRGARMSRLYALKGGAWQQVALISTPLPSAASR